MEPAAEHDDPYHRAATLLWRIESTHVFEDANKRTAWAVTENYLRENGIDPPPDDELVERVVAELGCFAWTNSPRGSKPAKSTITPAGALMKTML